MSLPFNLLHLTDGRAPGICTYGGAGLKKSNAIHTLPSPILDHDWEGGSGSLLPWLRRKRLSKEGSPWTEYTQEMREQAFAILNERVRKTVRIKPAPLIDVISYDNTTVEAYDDFVREMGSFDVSAYNSLALDSLQEFSEGAKMKAKGKGNEAALMNSVAFSWVGAQERAQMALRRLRNYRDSGVFIYMIGSEDISKDYVKSPMEKQKGEAQAEPYSVRGTVNLPGKLAEGLAHLPDILCHARLFNGDVVWITEPEPLPGGSAHWDAKDRFGRLEKYSPPSIREMCLKLYGEEIAKQIYASGR